MLEETTEMKQSVQSGQTACCSKDLPQELIPGLPDELAYQCLLRVPWKYHSNIRVVCRGWRQLLQSQHYHDNRHIEQHTQAWICVLIRDMMNYSNSWWAFDPTCSKWFPLPPMPNNSQRQAVGLECRVVCGKLVVCGGFHRKPLDSVTVFDPSMNKWINTAPMLSPRGHFVSGVIGERLYVAGGADGKQPRSQSAECYDPKGNRWDWLPSLEKGISFCLGVTLNNNLFVQARGGEPRETLIFSPDFNLWSSLNTQMLCQPIIPHSVLDGLLYNATIFERRYIIKGYNSGTDSWTELSTDGLMCRSNTERIEALVAFNGKLWAIKDDFEVVIIEVDRRRTAAYLSRAPTTGNMVCFEGNISRCHLVEGNILSCHVLWA